MGGTLPNRCQSLSERNVQYGLPEGHKGRHSNSAMRAQSWEDPIVDVGTPLPTTNTKPESISITSTPAIAQGTPLHGLTTRTQTPEHGAINPCVPALTTNQKEILERFELALLAAERTTKELSETFGPLHRLLYQFRHALKG